MAKSELEPEAFVEKCLYTSDATTVGALYAWLGRAIEEDGFMASDDVIMHSAIVIKRPLHRG